MQCNSFPTAYNFFSHMFFFFQIDVKLSVQYMSFSAHADAKGIMQLIRQVRITTRNIGIVPKQDVEWALKISAKNNFQ